ncbi:hypothetical protein SNE40_009958 [Patella caerulea]|uniref:HAT C-terminal dimerisation domain-containing protein n=1 Tax=Patella caerulea TaxID=87958 RepID=A0AAN8JTI3_PATCE
MINRFIEQQQAVNAVLFKDRKNWHCMPDVSVMQTLEQIDGVIFNLANITDTFSADTYVTVSALLPVLDFITKSLLKINDDDPSLVKKIKDAISRSLNKRYEKESNRLLSSVCSFLDPRFKGSFIGDELLTKVKAYIFEMNHVDNVQTLANETEASSSNSKETDGDIVPDCDRDEPPPKKRFSGNLSTLLDIVMTEKRKQININTPSLTLQQRTERELDMYCSLENISSDGDPLNWWQKNTISFPILSELAKAHLCIPATSCSSERLFSGAGLLATKSRNRLHPENVNRMLFLNRNLKL